jgi:hypothetical protein
MRFAQAVFLVGGRGTRLGSLTAATPKPLLDVGGRPFLDYLIEDAARHGFERVLLLAGHLADEVATRYDGREMPIFWPCAKAAAWRAWRCVRWRISGAMAGSCSTERWCDASPKRAAQAPA